MHDKSIKYFAGYAKTVANYGKIFMCHARNRDVSGNPPYEPTGVFAPFVYRYDNNTPLNTADDVDYSFTHHGSVDKTDMVSMLPGFSDFLLSYDAQNNFTTDYATDIPGNVDSGYLFLWIIQNVVQCQGDVKLGLATALNAITNNVHLNGNCQINIFFSDGTGVYAYTNRYDDDINGGKHIMSYKVNSSGQSTLSYLVRSWNSTPSGWTAMQYTERHLFYFPTQGKMQEYPDVDTNVTKSIPLKSGINYIGFPMLSGNPGNTQLANTALQSVNLYASQMEVKEPGTGTQVTYYYNQTTKTWTTDTYANRLKGYILTMTNTFPQYLNFVSGTATSNDTEYSFYQGQETWVPYSIGYSQTPEQAFGANFSHVTAIYAQDWYRYKLKGVWYGQGVPPATFTMDYGQMYKITVDANFTQAWYHFGGQSPTYQKTPTEYFTYVEEPSYQAVEIESIDSDETIIEIGAFKDGVCVGASVVTEYPIHLQVYDETSPELLDYQVVTASKSAGPLYTNISSNPINVKEQVIKGGVPEFTILNLGIKQADSEDTVPQIKSRVYPNPFRSTTSIHMESAKDTPVKVSIFNSKGEKVSELYNGLLSKGSHDLVWNGKNSFGERLAQGIYFYRIKTGSKTLTRKILMIK